MVLLGVVGGVVPRGRRRRASLVADLIWMGVASLLVLYSCPYDMALASRRRHAIGFSGAASMAATPAQTSSSARSMAPRHCQLRPESHRVSPMAWTRRVGVPIAMMGLAGPTCCSWPDSSCMRRTADDGEAGALVIALVVFGVQPSPAAYVVSPCRSKRILLARGSGWARYAACAAGALGSPAGAAAPAGAGPDTA